MYLNPAGRRMVGLAPDHPVGETEIPEYYPPEERAFAVDVILREMVERGHWSGETHFRNWKTGDAIPVSDEHFMIRDAGGRVLGTGTITRDISAAKRAEEALRQSESQYRGLIEHMPDGVFAYHAGRIVYTNEAFVRLLGHDDPAALVGKSIFELLHPDDHPAVWDRIQAVKQTGLPAPPSEFRIVGRDGFFRSVETVGIQAQFDEQSSIVVIVRDLTERKRAQEALERSEREFRELAESMPQIVWATGPDGRNIYFNRQWVDYTGLTLEESRGEGWIIPFHPDDRQRAWDTWERATQHRDTYSIECRLRRADGVYRWWLIRGVPLFSANGEISKWFGTCTDIEEIKVAEQIALRDVTERKRIEEELKAANASLDAIIENIPIMLFIKESASLRFVRFNRAGEDLLGWPKDTFIGKSDYDFWPPEQAEFFVAKDRETLKSGKIVDIPEEPIQTRHQGVRLLHTKKVPILDSAGHPIYLLGISEDITERRRIEKEQQFLAEVSVALSASLDYEQTMATLAQLVVQNIADWCAVDVMDEKGQLRRLKVVSADPAKAALCAVLEQMPPDRDLPYLMRSVD